MKNAIRLFRGEYYFLSNFYPVQLEYRGLIFKDSEAAFQSMKALDSSVREEFVPLSKGKAKQHGKVIKMRPDWEKIKIAVMYDVVRAKFTQSEYLKNKLLATGDAYLEEGNNHGDKTWGTVNGYGKNYLGKILMLVRKELSDNEIIVKRKDYHLDI